MFAIWDFYPLCTQIVAGNSKPGWEWPPRARNGHKNHPCLCFFTCAAKLALDGFFSVTVAWFCCLQSTFLPLVKENFTEVYCLEYTCLSSTELNDSHGHSLLCATQDGLLTEAIQTATAAKWHHRVGTTEPIQNGQR